MSDQRSPQNTGDTGSPTSRARDDLRTATKKHKPKEERDENRDSDLKKAQNKDKSGNK